MTGRWRGTPYGIELYGIELYGALTSKRLPAGPIGIQELAAGDRRASSASSGEISGTAGDRRS